MTPDSESASGLVSPGCMVEQCFYFSNSGRGTTGCYLYS